MSIITGKGGGDIILKKFFILGAFFILLIGIVLLSINRTPIYKIKTRSVQQITIQTSWGNKKIVTEDKDIERITNYINSIKWKEIPTENINGWKYLMTIKDKNGENIIISFLPNRINYVVVNSNGQINFNKQFKSDEQLISNIDKLVNIK